MSPEEQILVVPAQALTELGAFEGFRADDGGYVKQLLARSDLSFQPRGPMEKDPTYKQLIPYVVLEAVIDGQPHVYCYTRGKGQGESRLHAKRSLGIGGHISREDADTADPYRTGMQRELTEEVIISTGATDSIIGLIYDPTTEVGQVHLGIVHRMKLDAAAVKAREEDLVDAGFVSLQQLISDYPRFETWSQLVLAHYYRIATG